MDYNKSIAACKASLDDLKRMVSATENEVINGAGASRLITDNVNFFTKSFLITLCAQLEMCIKDVVHSIASDIDSRLAQAAVPSAILDWRYNQKSKRQEREATGIYRIQLSMKEVDDLVSGNVYKTKESLLLLGVDLATEKAEWEKWKELIQSIVTRRNNIVHHNDDASDLSFSDIRSYISSVAEYLDFIALSCAAANKVTNYAPSAQDAAMPRLL